MSRFTLCGVVLGLSFSAPVRADDAEDKAAVAVVAWGGTVVRDETRAGKPVVRVSLYGIKMTDARLKALAPLTNLTGLDMWNTLVTDAQLKQLASLATLTVLELGGTKVTDAGLKELAPLKNLTYLDLSYTGPHEGHGRRTEDSCAAHQARIACPGRHEGDGRGAEEIPAGTPELHDPQVMLPRLAVPPVPADNSGVVRPQRRGV